MKKGILFVLLGAVIVAGAVVADRIYMERNKAAAKPAANSNLPLAPNFSAQDLQGNNIRLEQYKGKVILVNFWATWCGPCRIEMPWFIEFQQKYGEKGLVVLGVAMDEEGASVVAPWIEKEKFDVNGAQLSVNYPILLGNDKIGDQFGGLIGLPTTLLISRDGHILKRFIGLVSHEKILKEIEANL